MPSIYHVYRGHFRYGHGDKKVIRDGYDAGCRNIPFDDCTRGLCVDPCAPLVLGTDEAGLQRIMEPLLKVNNLAIEGQPDDLVTVLVQEFFKTS